jgi:tRNA threonylcarbamoyladenosine biosynthesis protein TsaB
MKILALECSTELLSVAVYAGGALSQAIDDGGNRHGDRLLRLIDAALADAGVSKLDLTAVAFGCGPGAFTGVRMAVAAAQGIAYGLDIPAVPVSSLAALAQEAFDRDAATPILALADARMGEVYAGYFDVDGDGLVVPIGEEQLAAPEALALPGDDVWCAVGPGFRVHRAALELRFGYRLDAFRHAALPHASAIARLGARALRAGLGAPAHQALPVYLRDKVALTEAERAAARA